MIRISNLCAQMGIVTLITLIFMSLPLSATAAEPAPGKWSDKMQGLYRTLAALLTDITSDQRFYDHTQASRIEENAKKLSVLAHQLKQNGMIAPDADPTIQMLAGQLADDSRHAFLELKRGHRDYARSILRSVSSTCIACHTRNGSGPEFQHLKFEPQIEKSRAIDRGEFYAATRQFDRALEEYSRITETPSSSMDRTLEWEKAVSHSLAIAVRVKNDPALSLKFVQSVLDAKAAPYYLRQNAVQWKKSIEAWQHEPTRHAITEEGLHAEALRLIGEAREVQKYPLDHSADILYLRAAATVHTLLQTAPNGRYAAEAFLLAGLCYEVLGPSSLFDLHELYYEACIRKAPQTQDADLCYKRYEESIFADYSGSGGTEIPADVQARLAELAQLAHAPSQPSVQR